MENAKITWYIKEDNDYVQDNDYYLGSYSPNSNLSFDVQVWNNRYGTTKVGDIVDARLAIYFDSTEDNILLDYCYVSVGGEAVGKVPVKFGKGIVDLGTLLGSTNDGQETLENSYNYKDISVSFKDFPSSLKNGLKNMFLDIELD